jgi:hypothetical protein
MQKETISNPNSYQLCYHSEAPTKTSSNPAAAEQATSNLHLCLSLSAAASQNNHVDGGDDGEDGASAPVRGADPKWLHRSGEAIGGCRRLEGGRDPDGHRAPSLR